MRTALISDNNDTLVGMRLGGVKSVLAKTESEIDRAIDDVIKNPEIGILIVTENVFEKAKVRLTDIRIHKSFPLVVEVPDRFGQKRPDDYITRYIKESVGIKL